MSGTSKAESILLDAKVNSIIDVIQSSHNLLIEEARKGLTEEAFNTYLRIEIKNLEKQYFELSELNRGDKVL